MDTPNTGWKSIGIPYRDGKTYRVEAVCGCGKHGTPKCHKSGELVAKGACIECRERKKVRHGHSFKGRTSRTYTSWQNMLERCENPNNPAYKDYGKRGIRVCERWHSFECFLADMGERPPGLSLERVKNELGYWKENCEWATRTRQNRNTRRTRYLTYKGDRLTVAEWADRTGIPRATIIQRVDRDGMTVHAALTTPVEDWVETRRRNNTYEVITYRGETLTLWEWAERTGIGRATLRQRFVNYGWSPARTLTTPVRPKKAK